jgi:alcohol dehydrogenase class IV
VEDRVETVDPVLMQGDGRGPTVVAGASCLDRLAETSGRFGRRSVVVVADEAVVRFGYAARVEAALGPLDGFRIHVVPATEPTADTVDDAAAAVRAAASASPGGPLVVGVGGGSALDTAKLAAAVAGDLFGIEHYVLAANALPAGPPVIAIPTTSGTGSEVTRTCVLTDRAGRKVWAWGDELLPRLVLLDPVATVTLPPAVTAATGLDAFVHAVEAVTGRRSSAASAAPACRAIRLVLDHLPAAVSDGSDLEVRAAMQRAALLAGLAIDAGGTGIAHSIGHALGTLAHVPHGAAVAAGLGAAIDWNIAGTPEAFEPVAAAAGVPVAAIGETLRDLFGDCAFASVVAGIGPLRVEADALAERMAAIENRPMYENNCRRPDDADRKQLAVTTLALWDEMTRTAS